MVLSTLLISQVLNWVHVQVKSSVHRLYLWVQRRKQTEWAYWVSDNGHIALLFCLFMNGESKESAFCPRVHCSHQAPDPECTAGSFTSCQIDQSASCSVNPPHCSSINTVLDQWGSEMDCKIATGGSQIVRSVIQSCDPADFLAYVADNLWTGIISSKNNEIEKKLYMLPAVISNY